MSSAAKVPRAPAREHDEWDLRAANTLATMRRLAGLTLKEVGEMTGEDPKTIWERHNNKVAMGAMREYEIMRAHLEEKLKP